MKIHFSIANLLKLFIVLGIPVCFYWLSIQKTGDLTKIIDLTSDFSANYDGIFLNHDEWRERLKTARFKEVVSNSPQVKYIFKIPEVFNLKNIQSLSSELGDCGLETYQVCLENKYVLFANLSSDIFPELSRNQTEEYKYFFRNPDVERCVIKNGGMTYILVRFKLNNQNITEVSKKIENIGSKNSIIWLSIDKSLTIKNLFATMKVVNDTTSRPPIWFVDE